MNRYSTAPPLEFRGVFARFSKDEVYSEDESREILRRIAQEKM